MAGTSGQLIAAPLRGDDYASFNWIFLVEYVLCGILCLWFLFYFNRIFATLISYIARLFTWYFFGVYVDIEALQISILAGRVFFKGIRYHGDNETIFIHGGYITWRYWLRKVKPCRLFHEKASRSKLWKSSPGEKSSSTSTGNDRAEEGARSKRDESLPCRIEVRVSGVEAFIYNRSPAYDYILETCAQHGTSNSTTQKEAQWTAHVEKTGERSTSHPKETANDTSSPSSDSFSSEPKIDLTTHQSSSLPVRSDTAKYQPPSPPALLRLFPISVYCNKAAAVLGNENTPSILTAKIDTANGEFDASESGPLDVFKILMQFSVNKPFIQMKPNVDYKRPQLAEAAFLESSEAQAAHDTSKKSSKSKAAPIVGAEKAKRSAWNRLPGLSRKAMDSLTSVTKLPELLSSRDALPNAQPNTTSQGRWLGLTRYLDDNQRSDQEEWKEIEYAKASTLADLHRVEFKFYWDIAGPRPRLRPDEADQGQALTTIDANGGPPPEYGMELLVYGGTVHYGPWADRHRTLLQQLFFPMPFADAAAMPRVSAGSTRLCTVFELFLSIEADTVLRLPFREPSKDYKWKGRTDTKTNNNPKRTGHRRRRRNADQTAHSTHARPYAWFDILVKPNSTIKFKQDMFPTLGGYRNNLRVDVGGIDMHSSLNHALLWRSGNVTVQADLSNPLKWNGLHEWTFELGIHDLDFFLLRDHAVLLMDMIEDWTVGPLPEFFTFVPYRYILKPKFERFKLFLNVNDANIVDQSDDLQDNDFAILYGRELTSELLIPIDRLRPPENAISFDVLAHDLGFELSMPPKNTLHAFLDDKDVAQLPEVVLKGEYMLRSEVQSDLCETLYMEIIGRGLVGAFYGFFARQLAKIKENYFGDDVHFRTLQEYQELVRNDFNSDEPQAPVRGNDLDVILDITAEDVHILLPSGLYSCKEYVELFVDTANVDLRVNNYYLELMVDSSPLQLRCGSQKMQGGQRLHSHTEPQITLDSVNCYGHRLFGLPPSEPAYFSQWDIAAGDILGQCTTEFIAKVAAAAQAVALTITDEENGLPIPEAAPLYDTTLVRWRSGDIRLWLKVRQETFLVSTKHVEGSFNDLATRQFSQKLVLDVPEVVFACIEAPLEKSKLPQASDNTLAYFKTALSLRMVQRAANFPAVQRGQLEHIARHDARTSRASFLSEDHERRTNSKSAPLCLPALPNPLQNITRDKSGISLDTFSNTALATGAYEERGENLHGIYVPLYSIDGRSPFLKPSLPGDGSVVDFRSVPTLLPVKGDPESANSNHEDSLFNLVNDDAILRTSLSISTGPGIVAMCTPDAIIAASGILEALSAKDPDSIYDRYQMEVTSGVLSILKKRRGERQVLDLGINVPFIHVRFINTETPSEQQDRKRAAVDEYNVIISKTSTAVRVKSIPERKHADDLMAVHLTVSSISLSTNPTSKQADSEAVAFQARISKVLLWLADSDRTIVNASFEDLETKVASKELRYLAALIHRAAILAQNLALPFLDIQAKELQRRRFVVQYLATVSEGVSDPSFLTRPSYMIRSAEDHLRNCDSWKIIARLRWILHCLDAEQRQALETNSGKDVIDVPQEAEKRIVGSLEQWRVWDALHVKESLAMQLLYGSHTDIEKTHNPGSVPLSVTIRGSAVNVVVDHGSKQNMVTVQGLAVALSVTPPPPPSAMHLFQDYHEVRLTAVQVSTTHASVNLNWELCNLADEITTLFEEDVFLQNSVKLAQASSSRKVNADEKNEEYHFVVQMDSAEAEFEAINVTQSLTSQEFKISVVGSGWDDASTETFVSVVTSSREALMTTRGLKHVLLQNKLQDSSMILGYTKPGNQDGRADILRVAGIAAHFDMSICDELAGLIETVSCVVEQEACQIKDLIIRHGPDAERPTAPAGLHHPPTQGASVLAHVALFLDSYVIKIPLVQDVHYRANGRVLRLGVAPEKEKRQGHLIDFDLKAQQHTLLRGDVAAPLATAIFEIPAINGSVRTLISPTLTTLSLALTMEQLNLDGLALYGVFSMLSSSGVLSAFEVLSDDVQALQNTITTRFDLNAKKQAVAKKQPKAGRQMVFDASLAIVGFTVTARTHKARESESRARIVFSMDSTHLRASNRAARGDKPLPFPELQLLLGQMETRVERQVGNSMRESASVVFALELSCSMADGHHGRHARTFKISASGPSVRVDEYTTPIIVNLFVHFQQRMKRLDLSKERRYLRRLRKSPMLQSFKGDDEESDRSFTNRGGNMNEMETSFAFRLHSAHMTYITAREVSRSTARESQDLVFSLKEIEFNTQGEQEAKLRIDEVKLQMLPQDATWTDRSANSALLPELIFTVNHESSVSERRLLFRAAGKALDVQLHPDVVKPAAKLEKSLSASANMTRAAVTGLRLQQTASEIAAPKLPGRAKRISFLIVDVKFAGAIVRLQDRDSQGHRSSLLGSASHGLGRYNNLSSDSTSKDAVLRAPGIAIRVQYTEPVEEDPCLNVEIKIHESRNVLTPAVVPLVLRMAHNIKDTMHENGLEQGKKDGDAREATQKIAEYLGPDIPVDQSLVQRNPRALLGRTRLNIGMRIGQQEFALICQPIAKVEARMKLEDSYLTISTVDSLEGDNFFAVSATFTGMEASLQHVYSREPTFKFDIESIVISALNSKHISGNTGISLILKINPMKAHLNAKQLQDVLLFREIWLPPELREASSRNNTSQLEDQHEYFISRYRQIAASTAFPWNATVAIADLAVELDLGQAIGKLSAHVTNLWASSKKTTSAQQNLCLGIDSVSMDAYGRMSGFVQLNRMKVRTTIAWPGDSVMTEQTPLVQGSVGFKELRLKAAFDYQVFAVSHITSLEFIMYNVRDRRQRSGDRLVAILDGGKVHAYCVASTAALAVSLAQAFERLIQERKMSYEQSLKDIDSFLRRRPTDVRASVSEGAPVSAKKAPVKSANESRLPISLHTDVVLTLGAVDVGAFPRTVMDQQILRLETAGVQARFAVAVEDDRLHSGLGLTLGQVRAALAGVPNAGVTKPIAEIEIDEVVRNATSARGGVILRVPKVVAAMQTWQKQNSKNIDYKFRSTFEGKIDVGWNYSRISFIRGMHATHTRTLATRLGKPLPESAVTITGPEPLPEDHVTKAGQTRQDQRGDDPGKITVTSNVSLPQSRYVYRPLEPAVIDTPQLRDMGEATPPLEWIGLNRDKLPNVTHQVVIVTLLEVVKEVEDTYSRILGSA